MCTECVKTCAYDNVALFFRPSGSDTRIGNFGEAWQAIVMFGLAIVYCIINLGPWHQIRDHIDIVDKQNWAGFGIYAAVVWVLLLGVLPGVLYLLTKVGMLIPHGRQPDVKAASRLRACTAALVPLGLAIWIGFAVAIFCSMLTFVLQSLSDPFNWGWNLLGQAGSPWHILWAPAIPWFQTAGVLIGLVYSLKTLGSCWPVDGSSGSKWLSGRLPLAAFLWVVTAGMIWFYAG
jgi:hypothetical protein